MAFLSTDVSKAIEAKKAAEAELAAKNAKNNASPSIFQKIEVGPTYRVRVLPPWTDKGPSALLPYKKVLQHQNISSEKLKCNCAKMNGKDEPCAVCDRRSELFSTGFEADKDAASEIYARTMFIYQIIDRDDPVWKEDDPQIKDRDDKEKYIGKPKNKILSLSPTNHQQILNLLSNPEYGEDITNPISGLDLTIVREYTGKSGRYGKESKWAINPVRKPTPLFALRDGSPDAAQIEAAAELLNNLDESFYFKPHTYEEGQMMLDGIKPWAVKKEDRGSSAIAEGRSSQKALPPKKPELKTYEDWNQMCLQQGKALSREAVARHFRADLNQVPTCYAKEPDHTDPACWDCKVNAFCGFAYASIYGSPTTKPFETKRNAWSDSASEPKKNTWSGSDPLANMEAELSSSAPDYDHDDDIPF